MKNVLALIVIILAIAYTGHMEYNDPAAQDSGYSYQVDSSR